MTAWPREFVAAYLREAPLFAAIVRGVECALLRDAGPLERPLLRASEYTSMVAPMPPASATKGSSGAPSMVAPPRPICFIASKSAVMPSFVMLPFIQCHHVCGFAESGGLRKPVFNGSVDAAEAVRIRHNRAKQTDTRFFIVFPFIKLG